MSEIYIDSTLDAESVEKVLKARMEIIAHYKNVPVPTSYNIPPLNDVSTDNDTYTFDYTYSSCGYRDGSAYNYLHGKIERARLGGNIALLDGQRACLIRFKSDLAKSLDQIIDDDKNKYFGDSWLMLFNNTATVLTVGASIGSYTPLDTTYETQWTYTDGSIKSFTTGTGRINGTKANTITPTLLNTSYNATALAGDLRLTDTDKETLQACIRRIATDGTCGLIHNTTNYFYYNGLPNHQGFTTGLFMAYPSKLPDNIPVFDARDGGNWDVCVYDYLISNNLHDNVDVNEPNKPAPDVTDYKTDFTLYVTPKGANETHFSLTATNTQFTQGRADIADKYCMLYADGYRELSAKRTPYGQQTLTKSWSTEITSHSDEYTNNDYNIMCCFGDSIEPSEWSQSYENHSGIFSIHFDYKSNSEVHCKVVSVGFGTVWSATETCVKTSITDGYKFTASTGETLKILFRAITVDDLKDINDDGYDNESDKEEENAGTTATEVCGHGLGTYKISQTDFDTINDALWSTDWTQLFKSNTIDPVKCVISCKGIPFAHSGTATDAVYIANQRIECSAGKCNPVNTYNIGNYIIQAVNNNFTDMTMTKVRVYLPYIAWVELPAEEVISRVGRAEVGLTSVTKRLNFKYIVDFVDGSCRCVISVNGTERWFFDGNCGIDIPVTSDNHTSAINNAIKSGVQTVMNVGLAVGSAYAGNAMGVASGVTGAIGSLANTIPTYNYSATANSSGYINHSMGNKLVIVIESPNIQMPNGYGHKYGFPCMRNLTLGGLSGYTKCDNVDLTGVNGTNYELSYIKSALESGVYL